MAKQGAPKGNKNRVIPEDQRKETLITSMSLSQRRAEGLRAALIAQNGGGWPGDDEIKAAFRELAYKAVDAYIERTERDHDEAMII